MYIFLNIYSNKTFLLKCSFYNIDNSELVETSVIKDKCSRINNIRNKSETGIKIFIYTYTVAKRIGNNETTSTHLK